MKTKITKADYIRANRKACREAEIYAIGHPIARHKVHASKKQYNRKKFKAGQNDLPYFFSAPDGFNFSLS